MLGRDVEFLAAGLARHGIVDTDHVVAQLGVQRPIALIGARRDAIFLRPDDPAHLVLVYTLAPRTGQLVSAGFVPVIEEIAFVQGHNCILLPAPVKKPLVSAHVHKYLAMSRAVLTVALLLVTLAALGAQNSETLAITGEVELEPNIHSEMSATIMVFDHQYFVIPQVSGQFELANLRQATTRLSAGTNESANIRFQCTRALQDANVVLRLPVEDNR